LAKGGLDVRRVSKVEDNCVATFLAGLQALGHTKLKTADVQAYFVGEPSLDTEEEDDDEDGADTDQGRRTPEIGCGSFSIDMAQICEVTRLETARCKDLGKAWASFLTKCAPHVLPQAVEPSDE